MRHIPVISTIDSDCENLSLRSTGSCASLDHLGCNGGPDSLLQESLDVIFFIMPNMTTPEVISVVNSLDNDQILRFLKHFVSSWSFPFPNEYIL